MNFLSSNNIKHLSKQSQNLSSPQSIRLPLSNTPANQKINMINNNTIIHEFFSPQCLLSVAQTFSFEVSEKRIRFRKNKNKQEFE